MAIKSLSIRIDEEMLNKLHVVADYEGRSANSQILVLIRECIGKYEAKYGPINEPVSPDVNVKPPRKG
ncbi:MAG: Arc family DNA-binding protein [Clostridiales bacterium]|nr:Arc family DNA-binding protein [Clostridiales bacterium]